MLYDTSPKNEIIEYSSSVCTFFFQRMSRGDL